MCFFTCLDSVLRVTAKLQSHQVDPLDADEFRFDHWVCKGLGLVRNIVSGLKGLKKISFGKLGKPFFLDFEGLMSLLHWPSSQNVSCFAVPALTSRIFIFVEVWFSWK